MKVIFFIIHLLTTQLNFQQIGPEKLISCHYNNISFIDFCDSIYAKSKVRIYYKKSWIINLKVTLDEDSITVETALKMAVKGTSLEVSVWNNNLILLPGYKLLNKIPDFEKEKFDYNIPPEKEIETMTENEERYLKGRKADVIKTIKIGKKESANVSSSARIRGRMVDIETGESIIGATLFLEETGTQKISDQNGFIFIVIRQGKYNATFECMGYEKKKYFLEIDGDGDFKIEMIKSVLPIEEVIVHGDRQMNIKASDPGLLKIAIKTIKEVPTMMGERDILKISEMLPGIVSVGEGAAGLNVRGGNSDQNAFYINKIPVYNTSHLFGFFPAFNSDIIKDFSIYKGHIPAEYGGRLSSVFNIITKQGNKKQITAHAGINPITGSLSLDGPIIKDHLTFLVSLRTTYSDWILKRINNPLIRTSSANFYDFSAGLNIDLKETQISTFTYHSNDFFQLSDINIYKYSNTGGSVEIRHNFTPSIRGSFSIISSQYQFETIDQQQLSSAYKHQYKIEHNEGRADFEHNLNEKNSLKYGASVLLYNLDRGNVSPFSIESVKKTISLGKEQGIESSVYLSDLYNILPWMDLSLGLRYTLFMPLGPKKVYKYAINQPIDERFILDSISYGNNEPIKKYYAPEIRAVLNVETDSKGSIKIAFNQMHQNLFMLSNTIALAPNTQWKLADYFLSPSLSNQFSVGVFRYILNGEWETSLETFYKKTKRYSEFKDGVDFLSTPNIETTVLQGEQEIYGLEFFLKRSKRRLNGWLSYTYSHSIVTVNGENSWDKINHGKSYPSNYDIPHAINVLINYHMNRRMTASTTLTYKTGRPITYPTSIYYVNGIPYTDYSERNEYRIPDYFRMDMSVTIEGNLKKNKLVHSSWILSLYNTTGRNNPYSVFFKNEYGKIESYKYSVIGVPFFTLTWLIKLGNYVSD